MALDVNVINLAIQIEQGDLDIDQLYRLTDDLRARLADSNVESVDFARELASHLGSKGVDPVTVGALTVVIVQTALPKVLEFLQVWSLRNQGQIVKMKIRHGDASIEAEFSERTDPD